MILIGSLLLSAVGCASKTVNQDLDYHYSGSPIPFNDQKHIVVFAHQGEAFRPLLAVVDGQFFPASALRFPENFQIKASSVAKFISPSHLVLESRAETSIEVAPHYAVKKKPGFSRGLYTNRPMRFVESYDRYDGELQVVEMADAGDAIELRANGIASWISDLNNNGISETWIHTRSSMQVWENYKREPSLLLLDYRWR